MPHMANTSSAKKAARVESRRHVFNLRRSKAMKDAVKEVQKTANAENLSSAYQAIDKALKRGIIKKNTAARMKSRLSKKVK
jgi:small subunit ribosomal protein S20